MINFIKNWWKSEHCFAKNPLFWLLTAGACAAAPFTGFLSLAAIPVLAGVAQTGYLPHDKLSAGVKWLFLGNSVNKGQAIPQNDTHDEENASSSPHAYQAIGAQIANASEEATHFTDDTQHDEENRLSDSASSSGEDSLSPASLSPEAQLCREAVTDLKERQQAEQTLTDEQKWMNLSDEALYTLASIYKRRHVLHLNSEDEEKIATILNEVPEERKPLNYTEAEQREFHVCRKGGLSWQETDEDFKKRLEENTGRKIAAQLLIRFSEDHARLSQYKDEKEQPILIPFNTSKNITFSRSLQSVCSYLSQMLIHVFVRKEEITELTPDESTPSPHNWQVSPDFLQYHEEMGGLYDSLAETYHETGKDYDEIGKNYDEIGQIHDRRAEKSRKRKEANKRDIAEMDARYETAQQRTAAIEEQNRALWIEKINQDDESFSDTRETLLSYGYPLKAKGVKQLVAPEGHLKEVRNKLIQEIIQNDKQLKLTRICFETPENPNGFITPGDIHRLFSEEKASKIIQKLTSPPQASSSLFSFLPSLPPLTKNHSGNSQSSKGTSSDEETKESEAEHGKKKVTPVVQETFSI